MAKEEKFELDPIIAKLSENAKKELLRAFKGTTKNAKTIKEVWDDIVFMWAQHQSTASACTFAGITCNQLYEWEEKYNNWAKKEHPKHHPDENPIKVMQHAIKTQQEEESAKKLTEKVGVMPQHFADVLHRRRNRVLGRDAEQPRKPGRPPTRPVGRPPKEDLEDELEGDGLTEKEIEEGYFIDENGEKRTPGGYKKNDPYSRRGKYDIDLEEIKASPADINRIANNFKPASLKSGTLVEQARAIREEEKKLVDQPQEEVDIEQ